MTASPDHFVPFSLTFVEYNPSDPISFIFAFITLSPLALIVSYVSIILARREIATINMFIGQVTCEIVSFGLKRWIKEKRPNDKIGYGMPSSHAQFVSYFSIFAILYLFTRIYLNYHTSKQIIVGNIAGILFAIGWFILIENILRPLGLFDLIVNSEIAKYLYLRDSSDNENIIRIEYMNWVELNKKKNSERKKK
ncbi:9561_t:CDS:2 [Diversispora eburnea]|uniref:Dolichyldiphosphatase n=1 Tax=Diversispora eburnea TaxID=1213867 RepID=A0A9N8V304_9GLOM|nr:9561_t:CDS:2 [Diversispora eburnea]